MEAMHASLRGGVCVEPLTGNLLVLRGPGQIHRRLVNEAGDVSEDMEMGRHFHVKEMVLDTLVCRRLSFCVLSIPLYRFAGGLQTCNAGLQPGRDGLQPLATASNRGWF